MKPDAPGQSAMLLTEVVARLDALRIPYAVIGGLAASFHGVVRSLSESVAKELALDLAACYHESIHEPGT